MREYNALRTVYLRAHGYKPPPTQAETEQYTRNERYILEQQRRAHNRVLEERKKPRRRRCVASAEINAEALRRRLAEGIKDH